MTKVLANYQSLKLIFNQEVSKPLQMIGSVPENGTYLIVEDGPIVIKMTLENENIKVIEITSSLLKTPLYDEVFMALEKSLNCSSINFYNAYQNAIKNNTLEIGRNKGFKATHDARNGQLKVTITKEF